MSGTGGLNDRGATILEAMVAVVIVGAAAVTSVVMATESLVSVTRIAVTDTETLEADRLLRGVSLWPRSELDQRLGARQQGQWWLRIQRYTRDLYSIELAHDKEGPALLRTVAYRPERQR